MDVARIRNEHVFLPPLLPIQIEKLGPVLANLIPAVDLAAIGAGTDVFSLLQSKAVTSPLLQQLSALPSPVPYSLSWLPHCQPCFLLALRTEVYLIFSRDVWFRVPDVRFPKRKSPSEFVNNTLLLGELIRDPANSASGSVLQSRLLVSDLLVMSQTFLPSVLPLDKRLQTADVELLQTLKQMREQAGVKVESIQLHVRNKMYFPASKVDSVLGMKVAHGHEGLVLQWNGKHEQTSTAASTIGYRLVWRKEDTRGVAIDQVRALAQLK